MRRAQTATEYLIILAIVIIVAIVVMSVLGVIPGMGGDAGGRAALAQLQAEKIGVQSYSVTPNGTYVFLRNNHYEMIRIENITINEIHCDNTNPRLPITLDVSQQRTVFCFDVNNVNVGELYDYSLKITWVEVRSGGRYDINYRSNLVGRVGEATEDSVPENLDAGEENGGLTLFTCDEANSEGAQTGVFYNGTGTSSEPYGICNVTMLQNMSLNLSAHYVLLGDIDATGFDFEPIGHLPGNDRNDFNGSIDGQGYVISDLVIDRSADNYVGLFSSLSGGEIKNLNLIESSVSGNDYVGGLVGTNIEGSILDSSFSGSVEGNNYIGGFAGFSSGSITNSYTTGSVSGNDNVGGFIGYVNFGNISNSYSDALVSGSSGVGGFAGDLYIGLIINNSYSRGDVIRDSGSSGSVASFSGRISAFSAQPVRVFNSYSLGSVTGNNDWNPSDKGFVGDVDIFTGEPIESALEMSGNFFDINTSQQTSTAGNATGKTTQEMQNTSTFADWDTNIWTLEEGEYPKLYWQD